MVAATSSRSCSRSWFCRPYEVWHLRGTEPTPRPFSGYYGPKVVLQNWRSGSNAEMFPAGFRALGLGKLVGTQTMGAVIGTGSYQLIDGSSIRTPGVGVYLADEGRTNMENTGVKPDVVVENTPRRQPRRSRPTARDGGSRGHEVAQGHRRRGRR